MPEMYIKERGARKGKCMEILRHLAPISMTWSDSALHDLHFLWSSVWIWFLRVLLECAFGAIYLFFFLPMVPFCLTNKAMCTFHNCSKLPLTHHFLVISDHVLSCIMPLP